MDKNIGRAYYDLANNKSIRRRSADELAAHLEAACAENVDALLHEVRVKLPRLERFALDALARDEERFPTEKSIARAVIDNDIPRQERWNRAALLLLQEGKFEARIEFLLADFSTRNAIVADILRREGIYDVNGRWRDL
jgi:hypothetical protein